MLARGNIFLVLFTFFCHHTNINIVSIVSVAKLLIVSDFMCVQFCHDYLQLYTLHSFKAMFIIVKCRRKPSVIVSTFSSRIWIYIVTWHRKSILSHCYTNMSTWILIFMSVVMTNVTLIFSRNEPLLDLVYTTWGSQDTV